MLFACFYAIFTCSFFLDRDETNVTIDLDAQVECVNSFMSYT